MTLFKCWRCDQKVVVDVTVATKELPPPVYCASCETEMDVVNEDITGDQLNI